MDERALSLTPNVRRSWAPRGHPPVLTHPFNWKKASMAAALCYGVRGGGAQLAFHVTAGNYDTDTPGRGDRPGPQGHRPRPENAAPDLLVPPARRPVGRLSRQDNRILQQRSLGGAGSGAWRLEQLDGVAGGVIQQNLLATKPGHDVVAELHPCLA